MRKVIIFLIILFFPFFVYAESGYLYDVLKSESLNNGKTLEYTGEHHDSYDLDPSYNIYYWKTNNDINTVILLLIIVVAMMFVIHRKRIIEYK